MTLDLYGSHWEDVPILDFPGTKSRAIAVLEIKNFLWVEAFQIGKASMYQAGTMLFSSLTSLQKEKAWKIDVILADFHLRSRWVLLS